MLCASLNSIWLMHFETGNSHICHNVSRHPVSSTLHWINRMQWCVTLLLVLIGLWYHLHLFQQLSIRCKSKTSICNQPPRWAQRGHRFCKTTIADATHVYKYIYIVIPVFLQKNINQPLCVIKQNITDAFWNSKQSLIWAMCTKHQ